jgi:DNA-binding response OmpR family regulator
MERMPSILVVEDDAASVEMLVEMLSMAGYDVSTASTAEQAVAALSSERYEVALVDLTLPGATMNELVEQVRQVQSKPPMVVFSARLVDEIRVAAERLGAVEVLQKPASMDALLEAVARAAGHTP